MPFGRKIIRQMKRKVTKQERINDQSFGLIPRAVKMYRHRLQNSSKVTLQALSTPLFTDYITETR